MKLQTHSITGMGTREINEDSFCINQDAAKLVAVVADGLGGHDKGEVASAIVAETIVNKVDLQNPSQNTLALAIQAAQDKLLLTQKEINTVNAMKTTAVALLINEKQAMFAHVGDTRGYMFFKNGKILRTIDHSVPQMLALAGEIKESEIRYHSDRNNLLRVFGTVWEKEAYEFSASVPLKKIRAFLLCTDGFWELISEKQMKKYLRKAQSPKEWLEQMTTEVLANGYGKDMDNYTAVAVFMTKE